MEGSPYTPGAGHAPPVLAGRDSILQDWQVALNDVAAAGRVKAYDVLLEGPRGVGKTVTLSALGARARQQGFEVVNLQAVSGHAGLVPSLLHEAAARIEAHAAPWKRAKHAFDRIAGIGIGFAGFSADVSVQGRPSPPVDGSSLARALSTLAEEVRRDSPNGGLLITVDELQVAAGDDLALVAACLHRLNVDLAASAVMFAGTGLPEIHAALRRAGVTHPDRIFATEPLSTRLTTDDATFAITEPARVVGVTWHPDAVEATVAATGGFPAHLQLFADEVWKHAAGPHHIDAADAVSGARSAAEKLERRTLSPRWDRLTDKQLEYLAALCALGGRAATRQIARALGKTPQQVSYLRDELIDEGDVYAPRRGYLALTVPMFGSYLLARYAEAASLADPPLRSVDALQAAAALPQAPDGAE